MGNVLGKVIDKFGRGAWVLTLMAICMPAIAYVGDNLRYVASAVLFLASLPVMWLGLMTRSNPMQFQTAYEFESDMLALGIIVCAIYYVTGKWRSYQGASKVDMSLEVGKPTQE